MNKKILISSLSILSILVLSSCHGRLVLEEDKTKKEPEIIAFDEFDESKDYNISFWAKSDGSDPNPEIFTQDKALENAVAKFNTYYPNIHVELIIKYDYNEIYRDVLLNIQTRTTPNVCIGYPDNVATYAEGDDIVLPVQSVMSDPNYGLGGSKVKFDSVKKEEIYEKFLDEGKIDGYYYTLPFARSTEALYINKQYVESLGKTIPDVPTWDWVWEVCEAACQAKATELTNNPKADKVLYPFIYKSVDNWFINYFKQKGWDYTKDNEVVFLNNQTANFLLDLYNKSHSGPLYNYTLNGKELHTGLFQVFSNVSYPANSLNNWQAVMAVDSTAGSTWMGSGATKHDAGSGATGESFDTVVRPIPQVDAKNPKMISQGPSICVFQKADKGEMLASWLFAQFLLTDDIQLDYTSTEGYLPVTKRATSSTRFQNYLANPSEYQAKIDATKLVLNNVDNTFITPVFNGSINARNAAGYLIDAVASPGSKFKNIDIITKQSDVNSLYSKVSSKYGMKIMGNPLFVMIVVFASLGVLLFLLIVTLINRFNLFRKFKKTN